MNINEFCRSLDKGNPYREELTKVCQFLHKRNELVFERKKESLVETVQLLRIKKLYPVVDKKLGLILGAKSHEMLRTNLFRYWYYAGDAKMDRPYIDPDESAALYLSEGHGYYISAMRPDIIVVGMKYRPDSFDKDLFLIYKTELWES